MLIRTLLLCFLLTFSKYCLVAQTVESLQFEIDNLRQQITQVIENHYKSLEDTDAELASSKAKVKDLEKQNSYLRSQKKQGRGTSLSVSGPGGSSELQRLTSENDQLREQLAANRQVAQRNIQEFMGQMKKLDDEKSRLILRNDSLEDYAQKSAISLKQAEQQIFQLQVEGETLWEQLQINKAQTDKLESQISSSQPLPQKTPATLVKQESQDFEEQWAESQVLIEQLVADREAALAEQERLQDELDQQRNRTQKATPWPSTSNINYSRRIDSLKHENNMLKEALSITQQNLSIDANRIKTLEKRERDMEESQGKLEIKEHLLINRENDLIIRQHELEAKEAKYVGLEEKEKRLKLVEQRLKEMIEKQNKNSK